MSGTSSPNDPAISSASLARMVGRRPC
jgi:hypothetical protein